VALACLVVSAIPQQHEEQAGSVKSCVGEGYGSSWCLVPSMCGLAPSPGVLGKITVQVMVGVLERRC